MQQSTFVDPDLLDRCRVILTGNRHTIRVIYELLTEPELTEPVGAMPMYPGSGW